VPDDNVLAKLGNHIGSDFTGESAFFFPVQVLRAQANVGTLQQGRNGQQRRERRAKDFFNAFDLAQFQAHRKD
jgi:hypothetical protein